MNSEPPAADGFKDNQPDNRFDEPPKHWARKMVFVVLAVLCGILVWWATRDTAKPQRPDPVVPVQTAKVIRQAIPYYLSGVGSVLSPHAVTVRSQIDGELMAVHFNEGQMVNQGDLLAEIDPRTINASLSQVKAEKARVDAQLKLAEANLKRSRTLRQADAVSTQTVEQQEADVASFKAGILSAQAAIDAAETQLTYTKIISPVTGRVGIRAVDPGNIVRANDANGLVNVVQMNPIAVLFSLPQSDLPKLAPLLNRQDVPVDAFDRDGGTRLAQGVLQVVDNQVDPGSGTIRLKAVFPNDENTLWPGQLIVARLRQSVAQDALVLPVSAIQRNTEGAFVYRVKADQTVEIVPVTLRSEDQRIAVIEKGLNVNDTVVIDGQLRLTAGAKIKNAQNQTPIESKGDESKREKTAKPQ